MATNEILVWGENATTNILSQTNYSASAERTSGAVQGLADERSANKVWLQTSTIASGIAQFIADFQSVNVTDALTPAQISTMFTKALIQAAASETYATTTGTAPNYLATVDGIETLESGDKITLVIHQATSGVAVSLDVNSLGVKSVFMIDDSGAQISPNFSLNQLIEMTYNGTAWIAEPSQGLFNNTALTGIPTAPTATLGTNTTQLATTAFVQENKIYGAGALTVTGATTLLTTDSSKVIICSGTPPYTITLPTPAGNAGVYYTINVFQLSVNAVTLSTPAGTFEGAGANAATYALYGQDYLYVISNGVNWVISRTAWQTPLIRSSVAGSRAVGTVYTNATSVVRHVWITIGYAATGATTFGDYGIDVNGLRHLTGTIRRDASTVVRTSFYVTVPPLGTYQVVNTSGTAGVIDRWAESV